MLESLLKIFESAKSAGPLVLSILMSGGLGYIIWVIVQKIPEYDKKYETITGNHLHELPEVAETLRSIDGKLDKYLDNIERMDRTLVSLDTYLRVKLDNERHGR
jgi:hypothetical protein